MWVCLTKLQNMSESDSDELSYFLFTVDCRRHLKLPETYFGNCAIARMVAAKRSELLGEDGFVVAAKAIGKEVKELEKGRPLEGIGTAPDTFKPGQAPIMVGSSPRFNLYQVDFGWGRPRKTEVASLGSLVFLFLFSIAESREEEDEGGIELGLALAPHEVDSFNDIMDSGFLKLV